MQHTQATACKQGISCNQITYKKFLSTIFTRFQGAAFLGLCMSVQTPSIGLNFSCLVGVAVVSMNTLLLGPLLLSGKVFARQSLLWVQSGVCTINSCLAQSLIIFNALQQKKCYKIHIIIISLLLNLHHILSESK